MVTMQRNETCCVELTKQMPDEEKKQITAAIYARVSSHNQIFGYSLEEQIRLSRERCKVMGWKVSYIFKEDGISGSTLDRPKFQVMMGTARQGAFDVLVFWKLDRFCRSLVDLVNVERELRGYNVALHSITESIDTVTPFGKFNFRNIGSAAELERDLIKERSRMGMKALALKHKWPNKYPPLGYDKKEDGKLKINEKEIKLVREIFGMYVKLRSMPQVAFELNKKGVETKRGNRWATTAVKRILDNKLYIGTYEVADIQEDVEEYKTIDEKLFKKAEKLRYRYNEKPKEMPKERKAGTIEKVFNEYLEFLDDMENSEERII